MTINTTPPSSRLRDGLDGLLRWASMASPELDECDWGWNTYADNIRSILIGLDHDFATLLQQLRREG